MSQFFDRQNDFSFRKKELLNTMTMSYFHGK